ncbi:pentapeptide repeat-containing protein [Streptomyces sp. NPDC058612]|uniref:pentapeptide repeat-containing protein n=1 Tax=Streptomyces sp. NPDC058612 TaxID=3346555 RepID=UPI00365B8DDB
MLWRVRFVVPVALVVALIAGVEIFLIYDFLEPDQAPPRPVAVHELIRTTLATLTLVGAVLAGVYAYRKQRISEGDAHRADADQLAGRYTTAAEQLGHERAAVRLAGVYGLAHLADDWEDQRQVCIDVLCAYLRMPYQPEPPAEGPKAGEREVRWTIISVIRDHLQQPDGPRSWCACSFDFTGATFDGGDLSGSHFENMAVFRRATFSGGRVDFRDATFNGSSAEIRSAEIRSVDFRRATFSGGTADFRRATFSGGTADFRGATFSGGTADFRGATFSSGKVNFKDATFSGGALDFKDAGFTDVDVEFDRATFNDTVVIDWGALTPPPGART